MFSMAVAGLAKSLITITITLNSAAGPPRSRQLYHPARRYLAPDRGPCLRQRG
jgi:hypothetical protein